MRTKTVLAGVAVALAVPFLASAASVSDLQAQLASLLSQIQSIQSGSIAASSTVASPINVAMPACPVISRSLSIGSQGSDVSTLQQYLQSQGYLNVSATGYFGALTRAALGRWQSSVGISSSGNVGFGFFGPLSRSYFLRNCGQSSQNKQAFSADPQSGNAPLTVTFTTNDSITASSTTYSVDFGDGTTSAMTKGSCIAITAIVGGQGGIRCSYTVSHTYNSNGTYTAKLMKNTCPPGAECFVGPQTVATTVVTVGASSTNSLSFTASPTMGGAPLTVQFSATAPQGATLGNRIDFGDGTSSQLLVAPTCFGCNEAGYATHTYTAPGTYTATLTNNNCTCPANGICNCPNIMILGTTTVTVTATSTTPHITEVNAPGSATLSVNDIAEVRNESYYFTLNSLTSSSATIQVTQVGCWNSFPSDTPPQIRCMIAVLPIPPITLTVGQTASGNYPITLSQINGTTATFTVGAPATHY